MVDAKPVIRLEGVSVRFGEQVMIMIASVRM